MLIPIYTLTGTHIPQNKYMYLSTYTSMFRHLFKYSLLLSLSDTHTHLPVCWRYETVVKPTPPSPWCSESDSIAIARLHR